MGLSIAFAGAGNMAAAMARGWAAAGEEHRPRMTFFDVDTGKAERLAAEVHGTTVSSLADLASAGDVLLLGVKPNNLADVAPDLDGAPAFLSILGGTPMARLVDVLGSERPIIRTIPSLPVETGAGVVCYVQPTNRNGEIEQAIIASLDLLGTAVPVPESLIDASTAVMSCAPAYMAMVVEAMTDAGVRAGLSAPLARELVVETMAGSAALLRTHETIEVRRAVSSPGGSTAAGTAALERAGLRAAFDAAVAASLERMRGQS